MSEVNNKPDPQTEIAMRLFQDGHRTGIDLVKGRTRAALYDLQKEVSAAGAECHRRGIDRNESLVYMNAQLIFRQSLSFARLILNDNEFYNDEMTEL